MGLSPNRKKLSYWKEEAQVDIKFGIGTFGDMTLKDDGTPETAGQVLRNVVLQAVHAEEVGLDSFDAGEHHRDDFAITSPDTVLAGIATLTKRIKLGSGVTVLSSEDPVRVYQAFATIDALSNGRAEITAGRGSFIESFPLFGLELADYADLFEQKLELLVELLKERPVTWSGTVRAPLNNQKVYPKTEAGRIPLRVGVGGSPESVIRAARLDAALALAIIGETRLGLRLSRSSIVNRCRNLATSFARSRFTHPATSRKLTNRPSKSCGRATRLALVASVKNAVGDR